MKINNEKLVKRWNDVMEYICVEYNTIGTSLSELDRDKKYYGTENGITIDWMLNEAEYWYSCYFEEGHCRCDDKHEDYATWRAESGRLQRLITLLEKHDRDELVVEW